MHVTKNTILFVFLTIHTVDGDGDPRKSIFSSGRLLQDVQSLRLFRHPKDFLELWTKIPQAKINKLYNKMGIKPSAESLKYFLMENFENKSAIFSHSIEDWSMCEPLRQIIPRWSTRVFLDCLTRRWFEFSVKFSDDGVKYRKRHASIVLPQPFFVSDSNGRRWFETWDNLWLMDALLICGMTESARRILENMASLVIRYGHVPPKNRVYSLGRSSPPVFPQMLKSFLLSTGETEFVRALLPLAERDFRHWIMTRVQVVRTPFDTLLCALEEEASNIKRLLGPTGDMDITPSFILWDSDPPKEAVSVKLCSLTEWASRVLGELSDSIGDPSIKEIYERISYEMSKTIRQLLYSRKKGGWHDVDPYEGYGRSSSFWPLYAGSDVWGNETKLPSTRDLTDPVTIEITAVSLLKIGRIDLAEAIVQEWLNRLKPCEGDLVTVSVAIRLISLFPLMRLNDTVTRCQSVHKLMPLPATLLFTLSFACCLLTKPQITPKYT